MSGRFVGRGVLVTAAGHGIGRASARRFAAEGARVAVSDLRGDAARETAELCRAAGGVAEPFTADASSPEDVAALVAGAVAAVGEIDVVHGNAGVMLPGSVLEQTPEEWDRTFAVNVRSGFLVARAVLPAMLERGRGTIVLTASTSGLVGDAGVAAYNASKAAVISFTRHLTAEYASAGIRANCVCPGWIETGFNDPIFARDPGLDEDALVASAVPCARQGTADEVAAVVAFLASDDAAYVHGQALAVDGGLTVV
jgi:meso-butanediol dehydrogenase / (S,S)-butanediol dehydrogenase / diacetyl reductase